MNLSSIIRRAKLVTVIKASRNGMQECIYWKQQSNLDCRGVAISIFKWDTGSDFS